MDAERMIPYDKL